MSSRRRGGRSSLVGQLKGLEFDTLALIGREQELQQLRSAYSSSLHHPLVGISGYSGVGKTALVETFVREIQEGEQDPRSTTWFLFGKHDQQSSSMPYSAITFALAKLAIEHEHAVTSWCKDSVMSEDELALVVGVVPDLNRCFDGKSERQESGDEGDTTISRSFRSEHLRSALASFIRIISKHQRIVICLDDVQWADKASIALIECLATPEPTDFTEECSNLSLFLIWRANELESTPALMEMLTRCPPLIIEVGNLTVESLNEILAHTLQRRLNDNSVMELAKVIHRKTQGNVFFAKQVLIWLQKKLLLFFSLQSYQWEWNLDDILGDTTLSDNAVSIVSDKLKDLPSPSQRAVMVASCIGSCFDRTLLLNLLSANVSGTPKLTAALDETPDFELLEECDVICHRQGSEIFRFSHDLVQQAAYSLFSSQVHREKTHFAIGQFLLQSSTLSGSLKQLLATDQLNHGAYALSDDVDKYMLMKSNHEAALVAVRKSAFVQAERFHRTAIQVFPIDFLWMKHYDLALSMHSIWADTLLTLGEYDEVERVVNDVLRRAKSHSDTCRVLSVMVSRLTSMNRLEEASAFGYQHLRKVRKLKLSRRPSKLHVVREFLRSKRLLKKVPIEELLLANECNGADFGYQFILTRLSDNAFLRDDIGASMYLQLKILNMAFVQGPSKCTANALANYGAFLGSVGDFDGAYEVSKWVSAMAGRFKYRAFHFQDYTTYCYLSHLRKPLQELLDPSLECHRLAMRVGSMIHACICVKTYFFMYFFCGLHLNPLILDIRRHRAIFGEQHECASVRCLIDIIGQFALNLAGQCSDPFILDGEFFQRNSFMETFVNERLGLGWLCYWAFYLNLSYILDPSSVHVRQAFTKLYLGKKGLTRFVDNTTHYSANPICMIFCLAAIALERDTGKRVFTRKRKFLTRVVKGFVTNGVPGVSHRLFLIEAETLTLNAEISTEVVKTAFDKAISTSRRTGFVQDCAIANERCGNYFLRLNDVEWAEHYLIQAMELYAEWGATGKLDMMKTQYSIIKEKAHDVTTKRSSGIRSRERFKADVVDMHCAGVAQILFDPDGSDFESNSFDKADRQPGVEGPCDL